MTVRQPRPHPYPISTLMIPAGLLPSPLHTPLPDPINQRLIIENERQLSTYEHISGANKT